MAKKTGSQLMFDELAKNTLDSIVDDGLYRSLSQVAKGYAYCFTSSGFRLSSSQMLNYFTLEKMGLIFIPSFIQGDIKYWLTAKGEKVYQTLINDGVYDKLDKK